MVSFKVEDDGNMSRDKKRVQTRSETSKLRLNPSLDMERPTPASSGLKKERGNMGCCPGLQINLQLGLVNIITNGKPVGEMQNSARSDAIMDMSTTERDYMGWVKSSVNVNCDCLVIIVVAISSIAIYLVMYWLRN